MAISTKEQATAWPHKHKTQTSFDHRLGMSLHELYQSYFDSVYPSFDKLAGNRVS